VLALCQALSDEAALEPAACQFNGSEIESRRLRAIEQESKGSAPLAQLLKARSDSSNPFSAELLRECSSLEGRQIALERPLLALGFVLEDVKLAFGPGSRLVGKLRRFHHSALEQAGVGQLGRQEFEDCLFEGIRRDALSVAALVAVAFQAGVVAVAAPVSPRRGAHHGGSAAKTAHEPGEQVIRGV
jgi:hypothetical protein